jgi:hypothetical protein
MKFALLIQILWTASAAGLLATTINLIVARISAAITKAPRKFAPFTWLPIITGCFGGAFLAAAVFYLLHFVFEQPQTPFITVSALALLASFHLPFRLTNHRSPRFAGATLPMQLTLCLMHTIVAAISVFALVRFTDF